MIEQNLPSLSKSNIQNEISAEKKKSKTSSLRGCGCSNLNTALRPESKPSSADTCDQGFANPFHRQKLRMNILENVAKTNLPEETPEGVQQFIRNVSSFIEKKNPFKDKVLYSSAGHGKTVDSDPLDTIQFHRSSKPSLDIKKVKPLSLEQLSELVLSEKKPGSKHKVTEMLSLQHVARRGSEVESRYKANGRSGKSDLGSRKSQKEADIKVLLELEGTKRHPFLAVYESESSSLPRTPDSETGSEIRTELNLLKRKKPSEIPLRKNRSVKGTRQYYEAFAKSKPLSPLDKFNLCPELKLAIDMTCSSEKQNFNDIKHVFLAREQTSDNRLRKIKKLLPPYKGSKVSTVYSSNLLEQNPSGTTQFKIIDLNKMKTTSFTVHKKDSVLNKLESLHKKNILERKKSLTDRCTPVGSKTRAAIKSLKGKVSKKNLFRTSSKGNKPGLKVKNMNKKEISLFKKETPAEDEKSSRQVFGVGKVRRERRKPASCVKTEPKKETGVIHTPVKLVRTKAKSFLRGVSSPKETECPGKLSGSPRAFKESQRAEGPKTENVTVSGPPPESLSTTEHQYRDFIDTQSHEKLLTSSPSTPEEVVTPENSNVTEGGLNPSSTAIFCQKFSAYESARTSFELEMQNDLSLEQTPTTETSAQDLGITLEVKEVKLTDTVKGTFGTDEPPEGEDLPRVKKRIRIDLKPTENILKCKTIENNTENAEPCDWLFVSEKNYDDELPGDVAQTNDTESHKAEENDKSLRNEVVDSLSSEMPEESSPANLLIQTPQRSCSSLKRKHGEERRLYKYSDGATKTSRKKKIRTDMGSRRLPSPSGFFNSDITLLNKAMHDVRPRSGFTKSYIRDEKKDNFEDLAMLKLKRRNSEPHSLSGYVWKCSDPIATREHKPSVSSLASSLRHLNTDDIDDFTFWEAIPQRRTAWETSLYHFKRPWSVLSCSIFKDNRRSSTPGLILDNLRNGGALRKFGTSENERLKSHKEDPFDVEPSIAQKNIDVRNWLAALNFPTIPSTSSDFLGESNYCGQSATEAQNSSKIQSNPRRRKVVSNLKFAKEASEKICEETEKLRMSPTWSGTDVESLTELTRRISGGFLSNDQYINSEHAIWPNATLTFCVYSKSFEESFLVEASDGNFAAEFKSVEVSSQTELSTTGLMVDERGDQMSEIFEEKEEPPKPAGRMAKVLGGLLKWQFILLNPEINIWKYLFLFTIFVLTIHYFFFSI